MQRRPKHRKSATTLFLEYKHAQLSVFKSLGVNYNFDSLSKYWKDPLLQTISWILIAEKLVWGSDSDLFGKTYLLLVRIKIIQAPERIQILFSLVHG